MENKKHYRDEFPYIAIDRHVFMTDHEEYERTDFVAPGLKELSVQISIVHLALEDLSGYLRNQAQVGHRIGGRKLSHSEVSDAIRKLQDQLYEYATK